MATAIKSQGTISTRRISILRMEVEAISIRISNLLSKGTATILRHRNMERIKASTIHQAMTTTILSKGTGDSRISHTVHSNGNLYLRRISTLHQQRQRMASSSTLPRQTKRIRIAILIVSSNTVHLQVKHLTQAQALQVLRNSRRKKSLIAAFSVL